MKRKNCFETSGFKKLNQEWQKKLKESGFKDIESSTAIDRNYISSQEFEVDAERIEYIHLCESYFNSGKIKDKTDLEIFEMHCEGISNQEISKIIGVDSSTVDRRLGRILKEAKINPIKFGSV